MAIENRIGKVKNEKKGYLMDFDKEKIVKAIMQAAEGVGGLANNIDPDSIYVRFRGEKDEAIAEALTEDVILCLNMHRQYRQPHFPPTIEEIHDVVIDVLRDRGFNSVSSAYSIGREGQRAMRMGWLKKDEFAGNGFPEDAYKKRKKWCEKIGIRNTGDLNKAIREGRFSELVELDTQRYEKDLQQAVAKFQQEKNKRDLRVMIIAGPSSSGKTTTAKKLCKYLEEQGHKFKLLEVDNYFFSTVEYPRDWFGDMNYELPESIDLMRLNQDLESLMAGQKIWPPHYDFKTGARVLSSEPVVLEKDEILLLDCLHGLYPPTTISIPNKFKFKVYLEPYSGIDTMEGKRIKFTDIRALRRMCRDVRERGYSVQYTLQHWATVRKGEFKGIIPFFLTADAIINGGLIYDLPTLKYYLMHRCSSPFDEKILESYKDRGRMDVYRRGMRIKKLLEEVIEPSQAEFNAIPAPNLIREFIGPQEK